MLSNLFYCSVSLMVAQMLAAEDRTKVYRHEKLKLKVVEFALEDLFERIEDWDSFDGVMTLVEEIFNSTKQSYY